MASVKEATEKPSFDDFKLGRQLGEGNFSRIMVATHVATGEEFALKVIEKQRIKRLKVRHPNIFNEINMEKEVLNKVRHANIIRLYQTFQDETNLYFLLEHLEGGELLQQLLHEGHQVGLHEDLARFYLADVVNAVDFLHENGIMHRDLKPENMVLSAKDGHLRLIDFGTAKDLMDTALNGPNFVGTPEYMAPETVDNKDTTYAGDVWAFGCLMFQLLAGETPFSGGSVYLTLLKVQSGKYTMPAFLSESAKDLIRQCLQPDPGLRPSMKAIKGHAFFQDIDLTNHMAAPSPAVKYANVALFDLIRELHEADKARPFQQPLTSNDGVQPKIDTLDEHDRALLMHLLERKQLLHLTSVYPRFFASPSRGRCLQARNGGYIGLTHNLQNQWSDTYTFMMVGGPCLQGGVDRDADIANFRARVVQPINAQSPAFVVFCGDILGIKPDNDGYNDLAAYCQDLMGEIHPEVKLVFVPGMKTFESSANESIRAVYTSQFGDDFFSFWHGGVKFIVINSSLFAHESTFPEQAKEHEDWLAKELDNGKLCARETVLLSAHAFHSSIQGAELPPHLAATQPQSSNQDHQSGLPAALKKRIVELLGKNPVRLIVTTEGPTDRITVVQTTRNPNASAEEEDEAIAVKKTEMVVCTPPIDTAKSNALINIVNVTQSGITVSQLKAPLDMPKALSAAAPEDIDITLATEGAKLEISRDVATA